MADSQRWKEYKNKKMTASIIHWRGPAKLMLGPTRRERTKEIFPSHGGWVVEQIVIEKKRRKGKERKDSF